MFNTVSNAIKLCIITLILSILLSLTYNITYEPIIASKNLALLNSYKEMFPDYSYSIDVSEEIKKVLLDSSSEFDYCLIVKNQNQESIGYLVSNQAMGYAGMIKLLIGIDNEGKIISINYPETLSETPGVGMKVTSDEFKNNFKNIELKKALDVDGISGATFSSNAVSNCIKTAVSVYEFAKSFD